MCDAAKLTVQLKVSDGREHGGAFDWGIFGADQQAGDVAAVLLSKRSNSAPVNVGLPQNRTARHRRQYPASNSVQDISKHFVHYNSQRFVFVQGKGQR